MKTPKFRVWIMGLAVSCLALGGGYDQTKAPTPVPSDDVVPSEPLLQVDDAKPLDLADVDSDADAAEEPPGVTATSTSAPGTNAITVVQEPTVPEKVSPALQEIIKLVQAGVSEEVILSYVTNSTNVFNLHSDDIVYLNDLGVSSAVVTAIIHRDNTADAREKKHSMVAVKPLPSGAALNTPATNVYKQGLYAPPSDSIPMGDLPPAYEETEPATTYAPPEAEQQPVTANYFYNYLSPYGSWVDVPGYGVCWRPTVAACDPYWRPYSYNGRWLWTDSGWYWYSDYSWGWAPFHYGRWCSYPGYGWVWAPDTVWGPAWVTWRYSSSYCGWAPLPPRCHYVNGFGLYYRSSSVGISFGFGLGADCYTFIPVNRFCDRKPGLYYSHPRDNKRIFNNTVVINNYVSGNNNTIINRGVGVDRIAQANRGELPRARVRRADLVGNGGSRPERLENDGSTPVVVAPTVPARATRANVAGRPNRNGNKAIAPAANSLAPTSGSTAPASGVVANPVTRSASTEGRSARANANNDNPSRAASRPGAGRRDDDTQSTPAPRARPPQSRGNGNVIVTGATPAPDTTTGNNIAERGQSRQGSVNRPNPPGQNHSSSSSSLGKRLLAGNNRPENAQQATERPAARANPAPGGLIRGFSPQSQDSGNSAAARGQSGASSRGSGNRGQGVQSPAVISVPRQGAGQSSSTYRPQGSANVTVIPRSDPVSRALSPSRSAASSAPSSIAPSAPSAPRASAPSSGSGGGGRVSSSGGGNGGGGNGGSRGGGNAGSNR